MKTKFKVDLQKKGCHTDFLTSVICNHNEGVANISLDIIIGYMLAKKAQFPSLSDGRLSIETDTMKDKTIHISDDNGETFYITITECEMEELREEVELPDYMKMPNMEF